MTQPAARYGLQKIILLDGHIPGVMTRLDVSAHATLIGTNGAGKTTLLKLLPLFYGLAPNQLESRASGKKKFIDWYLPRPSSAIVFEYQRGDSSCCAVVYRHSSGTKPAYRFLNSAFTEDAFSTLNLAEGRDYVLSKELGRHWRSMGLECSPQLEVVTEYRAVIQRDRNLMNQSSRAKELRSMAARYGLGAGSSQMQHMEKVVQALVGRSGSMEKIRLMLAAIMRDEGVSVPKLPSHQHNERAISDISGLRQLKKELPRLKETVVANAKLLATESGLLSISSALSVQRERSESEVEKLDAERKSIAVQLNGFEAEWELQRDELNKARSEHKSDVGRFSTEIDALDKQRDDYEEADMESWSEKWRAYPQRQDEANDAQSRYDGLLGQRGELEKKFEIRRREAKDGLAKELQRIAARRQEVEKERTEISNKFAARQQELSNSFREQNDRLRERNSEQRETLVEARATRRAELGSTGYSDVETLEIKQREADIEAAEEQLGRSHDAVKKLAQQLQEAKADREAASRNETIARQQLKAQQSDCDELERLCHPDDRSLLSVLRQQQPGWVNNIGKVIDPALLQRTDLSPEPAADDAAEHAGLFGLQLQLDRIEPPAFADDEVRLLARLQAADSQRKNAAGQLQRAEAELTKKTKAVQAVEAELSEADQQLQAEQRRFDAARESNREFKRACFVAVSERKAEASERLKQVEKELEVLAASLKHEQEQLRERERQSLRELKASKAGEESLLQEREETIRDQENEVRKASKARLKLIDADLSAALQEDGIDEALLAEAKQALAAAKSVVAALRGRETAIDDYRRWRENQWPRRAGLFQRMEQAQELLELAERKRDDGEAAYKARRQTAKDQQLQLERALKRCRELIESLQHTLRRIAAFEGLAFALAKTFAVTAVAERQENVDALLREAESALAEREKLLSVVQRGVNIAEGIISRGGGTIADAWQAHGKDLSAESGIAPESGDFWRLQPKVVAVLVDEAIPTAERTLVDTMMAIGGQVDQFYGGLARVKTSIDSESRRISRSIEQALCVDVLEDIRVRLSSKVEELEFWGDLEHFHRQWRAWQQGDSRELPPEVFTESLNTVLKMLKSSRITGDVESLFDLEITLTENGRKATVRNDRDLQEVSSTGLSFLALCSIFVGLTRLLCSDREVAIHWPLDELGTLAPENVTRLFTMLSDNGIVILGGFPSSDLDLLKHFTHRYTIRPDRHLVEVTLEQDELAMMLDNEEAA